MIQSVLSGNGGWTTTYMIKTRGYQEEDARLEAEWIETRRKKDALQAELNAPTASRLYDAQLEIIRETTAAGAKCHDLLVKLRALRKGLRVISN
jgi:hypothetical protein